MSLNKINLQSSSHSQVLTRIGTLSEENLNFHKILIQLAFYTRGSEISSVDTGSPNNSTSVELSSSEQVLTKEQLQTQAIAIATEMYNNSIKSTNNETMAWVGLSYTSDTERLQLQPLGPHFYDGNIGIALFFAALFCVTGFDELYRDLTLRCLRSLKDVLKADSQSQTKFAKSIGIGGAVGIGCLVYTLTKVGQFLNSPELFEEALLFSQLLTPQLIDSDRKFDIVEGAAGAILGLLSLYKQTSDSEVLQKATACGEHLLGYCARAYSGCRDEFDPEPMTGYIHGASGLAYALWRLYEVTKNSSFLKGAFSAIAYENSFYVPSVGNWREFISGSNNVVFWSTICHGAPGIGLGLLGGYKIHQNPELLTYIKAALTATQKNSLNIDNLCCGNFGRVETLLVGARELSNSNYYDAALRLATGIVKRAQAKGSYELFGNLPNPVFNPGFFKGLSGIGYQLLRLAHPDLPSLLLWE